MKISEERNHLAELVIWFSFSCIVIISVVVISLNVANAIRVFNSVLPLFATWLGTVLAYYFSRSNFAAAASVYSQIGRGDAHTLKLSASSLMVPEGKIPALVTLPSDAGENNINVRGEILLKMDVNLTRIPVVSPARVPKYIIHSESVNRAIINRITRDDGQNKETFDISALTLADLLEDSDFLALALSFSTASPSATIADLQREMGGKANCKDLFVTESGAANDKMLGWITDTTLARYVRI